MKNVNILPRLIRARDASRYLGMDRNRFNIEVRPYVTEMRIGIQGIAFDRLDLDAWADQYKLEKGRPPVVKIKPRKQEEIHEEFKKALEMCRKKR